MKKYFIYAATTLLLVTVGLTGCKKDNKDAKDYSAAVKNTTWTGEFSYPGKAAEPVSIEFSEGGTLTWRELLNNYSGTWKLDGSKLSISFDNAVSFKGNISADSALTNLESTDKANRTLKNAALDNGAVPTLNNSVWVASDITLRFKATDVVDLYFGPPGSFQPGAYPTYANVSYKVSGRTIKFSTALDWNWFAVIKGNTTLKGTNRAPNDPTVYVFLGVKQ